MLRTWSQYIVSICTQAALHSFLQNKFRGFCFASQFSSYIKYLQCDFGGGYSHSTKNALDAFSCLIFLLASFEQAGDYSFYEPCMYVASQETCLQGVCFYPVVMLLQFPSLCDQGSVNIFWTRELIPQVFQTTGSLPLLLCSAVVTQANGCAWPGPSTALFIHS